MIDEKKLLKTLYELADNANPLEQDILNDVIGLVEWQAKLDEWTPCSERLPDNAKNENAFCPRYQITTRWGITDGWYNPRSKGWYVLIWFMTGRLLESDIDLKRGDIPKVLHIPDESNIVKAWKSIGEPWKGEQ